MGHGFVLVLILASAGEVLAAGGATRRELTGSGGLESLIGETIEVKALDGAASRSALGRAVYSGTLSRERADIVLDCVRTLPYQNAAERRSGRLWWLSGRAGDGRRYYIKVNDVEHMDPSAAPLQDLWGVSTKADPNGELCHADGVATDNVARDGFRTVVTPADRGDARAPRPTPARKPARVPTPRRAP
jgi:hypothetical protein